MCWINFSLKISSTKHTNKSLILIFWPSGCFFSNFNENIHALVKIKTKEKIKIETTLNWNQLFGVLRIKLSRKKLCWFQFFFLPGGTSGGRKVEGHVPGRADGPVCRGVGPAVPGHRRGRVTMTTELLHRFLPVWLVVHQIYKYIKGRTFFFPIF